MKTSHLFAALSLSLGLMGTTSALAQELNSTDDTIQVQTQKSQKTGKAHARISAEQLLDIGPLYEQLKQAGHQKIGSIYQSPQGIHATVVDAQGKILRLKQEKESQEFKPWEPRKDSGRKHRKHRTEKSANESA